MSLLPRIGHGFDVHAFTEGDALMLGGVRIPFDKAFRAHSDGDVLIHALVDALLGAIGAGDIGRLFPDSDPRYAGMDSRHFLRESRRLMDERGYRLGNADITVIAQAPKLAPHLDAMGACLAGELECDVSRIHIKATTTEGLGFTGRGEGIAVHAVVLLEPRP